jgi:multidrug efflux pump subunit AcrA (membrane-fusion protein)
MRCAGRDAHPHFSFGDSRAAAGAEANAAQIEARLGLVAGQPFDRMRVPDVMNAKASLDLAEAEFNRMRSLVDQKVISQSEFDQRRTQFEAARRITRRRRTRPIGLSPLRPRAPASRFAQGRIGHC